MQLNSHVMQLINFGVGIIARSIAMLSNHAALVRWGSTAG